MKKVYFLPLVLIPIILFIFMQKKTNEIIHPKNGPVTESVYAISTVKSEWNYSLRLGVISSVEKYFVKEGDEVKSGDKLLAIEGGTIFRSPQSGIVTEKPFGLKETIVPQSPIIKIVDLKNLYLEASIEQMGALKISKGMNVIISFDDFRKQSFKGIVRSVLPRDQDFLIQVTSKELPKNILPGMSADLSIEIATKENAMTIPTKAISNGYIIIKRNGKPTKEKIEIGISDSEYAEILSPQLNINDEIIIPTNEKH